DLLIQLTAIADSDGVTANDLGTPKDITPSCGAIDIRYGRATAMNGFGTDTEPIKVLVYTEYYDGTDWLLNPLDSSTSITYSTSTTEVSILSETPASPLPVTSGVAILTLTPDPSTDPGDPGGSVTIAYTLPLSPWLEPDAFPGFQAEALFGIYRGNDRIINWQEIVR
ncbi:MAG: hypothetical protein KKE17_13765, partial [Proteobacteria bacterium]|nr:hypothetical protein [Pseudomonadota bacterium]MBU1711065.1 hypothetical protein [Pseudomonadota bacterium]